MPSYYMIPFALQEGFNTIWWEESDTICHYTSSTPSKSKRPFAIIFPGLHVQHQQQDIEGQYKPSSTQMAFPLLAMKHTPPALTQVRALRAPPTLKQLALLATGRSISKHLPLTRGKIGQERAHNMIRFQIKADGSPVV